MKYLNWLVRHKFIIGECIICLSLLTSCEISFSKHHYHNNTINSSQLHEFKPTNIDSINFELLAYYPYHTGKSLLVPPAADVYLCKYFKDTVSTNADTVTIFDVQLKNGAISNPEIYWVLLNKAKKHNAFTVQVPDSLTSKIRNYQYLFASVQLATDD